MLPSDEYFLVFELITACPKEATIQPLVDILENDENSTGEKFRKIFQNFNFFFWKFMTTYFSDHHRVSDDEQNTEIDLVARAQEVAIDADRDHVAIATGNHPTPKIQIRLFIYFLSFFSLSNNNSRSSSPYRSSRRSSSHNRSAT